MRKRNYGIKPVLVFLRRAKLWLTHRVQSMTRWQRIACLSIAGVLLIAAITPLLTQFYHDYLYKIDAKTAALVGHVNTNLAKKLTYNQEKAEWQFNADTEASTTDEALPPTLTAQAGGSGSNDESLYAVNFPTDPKKGVSFTDTQTELSFTMTPQFDLHSGQATDGRLVYPMSGGAKLIYSAKNNGMKEDIVLPKFIGKELTYSYKLSLPSTLTARILSDGSVGIFSADPVLFGKISTASDMDAEKLKSAREQGEKNHLIFAIPAPVIVQSGDTSTKATATFGLNNDTLTVTARNMDTVIYPASIDPSVVVTSSSDFATGNNESNIDFSTDQINRGVVTGGGISGGWSSTGSGSFTARSVSGSAVYNGYLYLIGGVGPGGNNVSYAPINSNGTVGAWSDTTTLPASRLYPATVPYNGKMYVYGGYTSGTSALNTVLYANINSDGTLGSWTSASNNMASTACRFGWTGYNGYLYAVGGATGTVTSNCGNSSSTMTNTLQYAPILANGDVGAWTTSANTFTNARKDPGFAIYNGNAYMSSGTTDGIATYRDTQIAKINSTGDIGAWRTSAEEVPTNGKYRFAYRAYNGYLYLSGGTNNLTGTLYAQLYANGDIGPWQASSTMSTGRYGQGFVLYKGYAYYFGGNDGSNYLNDTGYAKIDPPGQNTAYTASSSFTTTRRGAQTVAYNGYLYVMGGDAGSTPGNTIRRATLNSNGTVGGYSTDRNLPTNLTFFSAVAYGGYMYVVGGCTSAFSSCTTAGNNVATIYRSAISTSDGSLGAWSTDTSFNTARYGLSAVAYNGYLYVIGGLNGSTFQNDIQYHAIGASGAISGAWSTSSYAVPTARAYQGAAVNGGKLYIAGGCSVGALTCTTTQNDIQYGTFGNSGELTGSLTANGTSFTTPRGMHGFVISGGYAYVIGGWNGSTYYGDTQFAPINADGSLGNWTSGQALSGVRAAAGYAAYNGILYIAGGNNGGTYYSNTYYAILYSGGSGAAGSWSSASNSLSTPYPNGIAYNGMFVYEGYLYTVGGYSNGSTLSSSWSAPLQPDGSTGTWTQQASMPVVRSNFALSMWNGYVYVCTGGNGTTAYRDDCTYAQLQSGGGLGGWSSNQTMNLLAGSVPARSRAMGTAYGGYLYVLGGADDSTTFNTVYYAPINSATGAIGIWQTGNTFSTGRASGATFAAAGNLYVVGGGTASGTTGSGSEVLNDVQFASLSQSDGSVGTWKVTESLIRDRMLFVLSVANGYVYVYGGTNDAGGLTMIEQAPILASGHLGAWQRSGVGTFANPRSGGTGTIANGYVYLSSGRNSGGTFFSDIQYTPLSVQPRVATYSRLFDLGALYTISSISHGGVVSNNTSSISYRKAGADGVLGSSTKVGTENGGGSVCSTGDTRYVFVTVKMDDSLSSSLPDANSSVSYISDISVNYIQNHAATNTRLAHGKYFEYETLQPLDTCTSS